MPNPEDNVETRRSTRNNPQPLVPFNPDPEAIAHSRASLPSWTPRSTVDQTDLPGASDESRDLAAPRSLSQLLAENRRQLSDPITRTEANIEDRDEATQTVDLTTVEPPPESNADDNPDDADTASTGSSHSHPTTVQDFAEKQSQWFFAQSQSFNAELSALSQELESMKQKTAQLEEEINLINQNKIPEAVDRAVNQAVPLASDRAVKDVTDRIPTREAIVATIGELVYEQPMQETISTIARDVATEAANNQSNLSNLISSLMDSADFAESLRILINQSNNSPCNHHHHFATHADVDEIARNLLANYMETSSSGIRRAILDQVEDRLTTAIQQELTQDSPINKAIRDEIRHATEDIVKDELANNQDLLNIKKSSISQYVREQVQTEVNNARLDLEATYNNRLKEDPNQQITYGLKPATTKKDDPDDPSSDSSSSISSASSTSRKRRNRKSRRNCRRKTDPDNPDLGGLTEKDVIIPTIVEFTRALDFRTYRLRLQDQTFSGTHGRTIPSFKKKMTAEMESHIFDGKDSIKILDFLAAFRRACDGMGVHEGAAVFLFTYFMTGNPAADLSSRIESNPGNFAFHQSRKEDVLTSYCQIVNYLLRTYADNQTISRTNGEIIRLTQRDNQSPVKFKNFLWSKMSRCGCVYSQEQMIGFFIEGCNTRIRNLVRTKFEEKKDMTLTKLAEFARDMDARTDGRMWTSDNEDGEPRRRKRKEKGRNEQQPSPLFSTEETTPPATSPVNSNYSTPQPTPPWRPSNQPSPVNPRPPHNNNNNQLYPINRRAGNNNNRNNYQQQPSPTRPTNNPQIPPDVLEAAMRSMNSGNFCRICFAPITDHVTTECPYTLGRGGERSHQEFIVTRNTNYQKAIELGLLNKSRYTPQNHQVSVVTPRNNPPGQQTNIPQQPPAPKN